LVPELIKERVVWKLFQEFINQRVAGGLHDRIVGGVVRAP
jgi:hypothetical protein